MNFLAGSVSNGVLHAQGADIPLGALAAKGDVTLGIRPENIGVADEAAGKDVTWDALVELREPLGGEALVWCFFGKQRICIRVRANLAIKAGDRIHAGFNLADASFFDTASGNRL
jgi:multiple sugar transport system ATP-binding protein